MAVTTLDGAKAPKTDYSGRRVLLSNVSYDNDGYGKSVLTTFDGSNTGSPNPYIVNKEYYRDNKGQPKSYLIESGYNNNVGLEVFSKSFIDDNGVPVFRTDTNYNGLYKGDPGYEELLMLYRGLMGENPTPAAPEQSLGSTLPVSKLRLLYDQYSPLIKTIGSSVLGTLFPGAAGAAYLGGKAASLLRKKNGGAVDWVGAYQDGGVMNSEESTQDLQLNTLAAAMLQLLQLSAAAENGDELATSIMAEVQKRAQLMALGAGAQLAKRGTKLLKKGCSCKSQDEKKKCGCAKCGKKLMKATSGCACKKHIMRQGGRVITVDCNNNIVK